MFISINKYEHFACFIIVIHVESNQSEQEVLKQLTNNKMIVHNTIFGGQ